MNYKNVSIGLILAFGLATGVAAQQSTPKPTPAAKSTQTETKKTTANGPTKLTGCIERGPAATGTSTVTPPGTPPPPPMYKLTHFDSTALKSAMSNPDTKTSADVATATEIGLRADKSLNLAEHIDHKVELTGKIVTDKSGSKASGRAATETAGIHVSPIFQVTSVKMVAATCQ